MSHYDKNCTQCEKPLSEVSKGGFWHVGWYVCKNECCTAHDTEIYARKCNFCDNLVKLVKNSTDGLAIACFECSSSYT